MIPIRIEQESFPSFPLFEYQLTIQLGLKTLLHNFGFPFQILDAEGDNTISKIDFEDCLDFKLHMLISQEELQKLSSLLFRSDQDLLKIDLFI